LGVGVSSWSKMKNAKANLLQSNDSNCRFTRHYQSQLINVGDKESIFVCPSVCHFFSVPFYLSLSFFVSFYIFFSSISVYFFFVFGVSLRLYVSLCLPVFLALCLSVCIFLSLCLSVSLSLFSSLKMTLFIYFLVVETCRNKVYKRAQSPWHERKPFR